MSLCLCNKCFFVLRFCLCFIDAAGSIQDNILVRTLHPQYAKLDQDSQDEGNTK